MTRRRARRAAGELESEVLAELWAADGALTPAEIQAQLGDGLAYNTVHTIVTRLLEKGLVVHDPSGRRGSYRPAKDAAEVTAEQMHELLDRGPDRLQALERFVTALRPSDEKALRAFLPDRKR